MKNLFTLLLLICINSTAFAQDPQLFEKDWRCEGVTLDTGTYIPAPPQEPYTSHPYGYFAKNEVVIQHCEARRTFGVFSTTDNIFTLEHGYVTLIENCQTSTKESFQALYFGVFWDGEIAKNPFSYTIVDDGSFLSLEVVNALGAIAHYTNAPLATSKFESKTISVYPNPVTNHLNITSEVLLQSIDIYDIQGREVHAIQFQPENPKINTETLNAGVYFLKAESNTGQLLTAKFVKL